MRLFLLIVVGAIAGSFTAILRSVPSLAVVAYAAAGASGAAIGFFGVYADTFRKGTHQPQPSLVRCILGSGIGTCALIASLMALR